MTRRPQEHSSLAEPDELDQLVAAEARLEKRLTAARVEARRHIEAAEAGARSDEEALERELAPSLAGCRERAARELTSRRDELRHRSTERAAALEALRGARFDSLVERLLARVAEPSS